jgi:hypothetical protein
MRSTASVIICVLLLAGVAAACGEDSKQAATTTVVQRLPQAQSAGEWAQRVVDNFLRPLNKDLTVLNALNVPDIRIYIASANPQTLRILRQRMNHLSECGNALTAIGPPPGDAPEQNPVFTGLNTSCTHYQKVSTTLLKALPLLSSGRADVAKRGQDMMDAVKPDTREAANALVKAICTAQRQGSFQRAGLRPSTC